MNLPVVHLRWLYMGQQESHSSPHVLCRHLHVYSPALLTWKIFDVMRKYLSKISI